MAKLPDEFDPKLYLYLNPDVAAAGVDPVAHWNAYGQAENRDYGDFSKKKSVEENHSKLAILLMCKNEGYVLEAWIKHHLTIVKPQDLYIFDNGSTDTTTHTILKSAINLGCNVEWKFDSKEHFNSKGSVMIKKMQELDANRDFDFYIPLDTDELLAVKSVNNFETSADLIYRELALLPKIGVPLRITKGLESNPYHRGFFRNTTISKSFFRRETMKSLDVGFHEGQTISGGTPFQTDLVLLDFHHMNFSEVKKRAIEKLEGRVDVQNSESLKKHETEKLAGFHLVREIFMDSDGHRKSYPVETYDFHRSLTESLNNTGVFESLVHVMSYETNEEVAN